MAGTQKYHITDKGEVKPCEASVKECKYAESGHYDTPQEAEKVREEKLSQHHGEVSTKKAVSLTFDTHSPQVDRALQGASYFQNTVKVKARITTEDTPLSTTLKDGTVETTLIVPQGHFIITNTNGEEYAVSPEKFNDKYNALGNGTYQAKGVIRAFRNPTGKNIEINTPWGEKQHGGKDSWIVENPSSPGDRYLIGDEEFTNTYTPKPITSAVHPKKGGSYLGTDIPHSEIGHMEEQLKNLVGDEEAAVLIANKINRDGNHSFHMTVLSPKETRTLKKNGTPQQQSLLKDLSTGKKEVSCTVEGLGKAQNEKSTAYFAVVSSPDADALREKLQLPKKDFHITLGFTNGDVHDRNKGRESIVV